MDLDLRLVRYFTVVAEHGTFHRAAEELRVAQPSLSRQVQRLEELLGVRLLDRTPQGSRLTDAGRAFLPDAHALLRSADVAAARARATAGVITVGHAGGLLVTAAVRDLRHRHPDVEVRTLHLDWDDVRAALLEHRVDVAVAREPFATDGLRVTTLAEEPRVLLVPDAHRLAGKDSVSLDDFADEPLVRYADPDYDAFWRVDPRPDGRRAPDGPLVGAHEDKLEQVAGGRALALAPAGSGPPRPDLVAIPVDGIAPCRVVLAVRADERGPLVAAFHDAARTVFTRSQED